METIEPSALQKGDWVQLRNGWVALVKGKAKGIRIFLEVYGDYVEMGDVYTRDVIYRLNPLSDMEAAMLRREERVLIARNAVVQPNAKHAKQFERIAAMGF